jgi:serine-type D-Ala-D-Ala carboxypeptidase/endopeptidase (penicillin-binding protein 4)
MTRKLPVILLLLVFPALGLGQAKRSTGPDPAPAANATKKPAKPAARPSKLATVIDGILDDGGSARANWGVLVVDLKDGRTVYARNDHRLFAPASNTKLFTTATALETLGPQFRTRTTVEAATPPDAQGGIAGDLVLVGRGDPNLSPRVLPYQTRTETFGSPVVALDRLADQLADAGVHTVTGDVIGDDTYFVYERYGEGWTVDDTLWSYGAPVSALTINDNNLALTIEPGEKPGDAALLKLEPFENYFTFENRIKTVEAGAGRRVFINREPGSRLFEVWGHIAVSGSALRDPLHETLAMDDPADLAARYLRDALIARGITVKGQAKARHRRAIDAAQPTAALTAIPGGSPFVLAMLESRPLADDLKVINKVSQNLHAEMTLRLVGREHPASPDSHDSHNSQTPPGSVATGLAAVKEFLLKAGLLAEEFAFYDGCGLSRAGLVAPAATVRLLTYMDSSPNREIWLDTLPQSSADGSLNNRLKTTCTASKVQAKTGTLRHVAALSGYMTASHGHRLAFSIMVNNHTLQGGGATGIMDKVLDEICKAE